MRRDFSILKNWRHVVEKIVLLAREFDENACIHVFGSIVEGEITGSSDIDVLLVVSDRLDVKKLHLELLKRLEDMLGDKAYIVDLHVINQSQAQKPPYTWWVKNSLTIC